MGGTACTCKRRRLRQVGRTLTLTPTLIDWPGQAPQGWGAMHTSGRIWSLSAEEKLGRSAGAEQANGGGVACDAIRVLPVRTGGEYR
ncbi:hypothetical protein A0H81_12536 [Grifola frondosa]|uniref:Uncharacterized protein n=1 Tax=Grifola frondosa TaxID=5627 RepID=A0A1C7LT34_GRIFR|nr:hypothetical protein A0H81_12536 [Grifola frondosa]